MRNDFKRKPSSLACVFGELEPRMSSQNAMILSLFDFKESMTGHKILSHSHGPKAVPKGMHTMCNIIHSRKIPSIFDNLGRFQCDRSLEKYQSRRPMMNFQIFPYPLCVIVGI